MFLFLMNACDTELAEEDAAPMEEAAGFTATLPAFVQPKPEPRVERFTRETLNTLTSGQTPPACHYLSRYNQLGGFTSEMDDGPGVAWDVLVTPVMDRVSVNQDGSQYELVKVLVPDLEYGEQWVQVNWFPAEVFVPSPDQAAYFGEPFEPSIPGTCTMPPQPEKAVAMEATLTVTDPTTGATTTFEGAVQPEAGSLAEPFPGKPAPQP